MSVTKPKEEIIAEFLAAKGVAALKDLDKESLKELADQLAGDDEIEKLYQNLCAHRDKVASLNDCFPETQAFLKARGLTSVKQLDNQGVQELTEHLLSAFKKIAN